MELTVEVLREAEFREGWRGYNPVDVDEFIDRVSVGVQELHDRIHALTVRAERAESRLGGENDETVKRTLVLAQRAADLVVSEAKSVAERIVQDAHREAERTVADANAAAAAKREQFDHEIAIATERKRADAQAEHEQLMHGLREHEQVAHRQAQLASARANELNAQVVALRDRFRSALTDQIVRLDHLVDSTPAAGDTTSTSTVPSGAATLGVGVASEPSEPSEQAMSRSVLPDFLRVPAAANEDRTDAPGPDSKVDDAVN